MRVLEWLYRHVAWLNLVTFAAVILWVAWLSSIGGPFSSNATAPAEIPTLKACPCTHHDDMPHSRNRT
ncbi:hypothetical protein [Burkholderia gladioli]|uniref:hypothetical protein n=1 Tax=Burkholderia gladioli TaxID=28095 RepID=UPI0002FA218D|nr:hypothetical protein [Burkholderia gladioli]MBW5285056.1 hypothetical protein [Burkholderia gladioli]